CRAVVQYLRLALWPHPLVFDYGIEVVIDPVAVLPQAIVILAIVVGTLYALRRHPALGFLGAWFLLILAPTSSVVPIATQTVPEHRVYLPLAGVAVLFVVLLYRGLGWPALGVAAAAAFLLGVNTAQRNEVYGSEIALWSDTVAKLPASSRARNGLGLALS